MKQFPIFILCLLFTLPCFSQVEYLLKIDPINGTFSKVDALPNVNWITTLPRNTTFDPLNGNYTFRGGDAAFNWSLITVDAATGTILHNPPFPQLTDPSDNVTELQYDGVTGLLYAVHWDNSAMTEFFVSIDPTTGVHTIISTISGVTAIANSTYDYINGNYILDAIDNTSNRRLYTIQATTGTILSNPTFPNVGATNDNISEVQFDNTTGLAYGLYYDNSANQMSFCSVDLLTGNHTLISTLPGSTFYAFPNYVTYDHINGRYFFRSGSNDKLYTIDVTDGSVIAAIDFPDFCDPLDNIVETQYGNAGEDLYALHWSNANLSITATQSGPLSCNQTGFASVMVSSPGSYQYQWSNGATTASISGLSPDTYTVFISSAAGCIDGFETFEINGQGLTATTSQQPECNIGSGAVSVSATCGTPPYTYQWSNGGTTPTISGLSTYYNTDFYVTVTDANGDIITAVETLETSEIFVFQPYDIASCITGLGDLMVSPTTNSPPLNIIWSTGQTTMTVTGLAPGSYSATLTNAVGCTFSFGGQVDPPLNPVSASVSSQQPTSCGGTDGSIALTVSSGTGPYTYSWNTTPPQTTATINGLSAGTYQYTVTDDDGCLQTGSVILAGGNAPTATFNSSAASCSTGLGGSVTAIPTGGSPPYTYLWSNNQATQTINNQAPGTYLITITDSGGCSITSSVMISGSGSLTAQMSSTAAACGNNNGTASVMTTQGTGPFTYVWNTTPPQTTATAIGLAQGSYDYTLTDSNGCMATGAVMVSSNNALTVSVMGTDGECSVNSASASAIVTGGSGPFTYLWSNNATMQTIGGLATGTYMVTVTDGNGCVGVQTISVVSNANGQTLGATHTNVSCPGSNDGSIDLTVNNGTPPFQYDWIGGITSEDRQGLPPGAYTVLVTDANGCLAATTVVISEPDPMVLTPFTTSTNSNDGTAAVNINGGVPPFTYQWSDGQTSQVATGLTPGTYSVIIVDANGCTTQGTVTVDLDTNNETIEGLDVFAVYPVPTDGQFTVEVTFSNSERLDFQVLDVLGRVLFSQAIEEQVVQIPVDISGVANGIYILELRTTKGKALKEILVISD